MDKDSTKTKQAGADSVDFLLLGMPVAFSHYVLLSLLQTGVSPKAVCVADPTPKPDVPIRYLEPQGMIGGLRLLNPFMDQGLVELAWNNEIPVWAVSDLTAVSTLRCLAALEVDAAFVACFPWRISPEVLAISPTGFFNVHPSLLPAYRGPYPLFWTFRDGLRRSGVTLHHVDKGLDTGDIVCQETIDIPDGISEQECDKLFAHSGANLIERTLEALAEGRLERWPQGDGVGYYGRPAPTDFDIPTSWTAQRAFNFMCGTNGWQQPYRIIGDGFELAARNAVGLLDAGYAPNGVTVAADKAIVPFANGALEVAIW